VNYKINYTIAMHSVRQNPLFFPTQVSFSPEQSTFKYDQSIVVVTELASLLPIKYSSSGFVFSSPAYSSFQLCICISANSIQAEPGIVGSSLKNITVPEGRDVVLSCTVKNLNGHKVCNGFFK
jgi:hypothetical protein